MGSRDLTKSWAAGARPLRASFSSLALVAANAPWMAVPTPSNATMRTPTWKPIPARIPGRVARTATRELMAWTAAMTRPTMAPITGTRIAMRGDRPDTLNPAPRASAKAVPSRPNGPPPTPPPPPPTTSATASSISSTMWETAPRAVRRSMSGVTGMLTWVRSRPFSMDRARLGPSFSRRLPMEPARVSPKSLPTRSRSSSAASVPRRTPASASRAKGDVSAWTSIKASPSRLAMLTPPLRTSRCVPLRPAPRPHSRGIIPWRGTVPRTSPCPPRAPVPPPFPRGEASPAGIRTGSFP